MKPAAWGLDQRQAGDEASGQLFHHHRPWGEELFIVEIKDLEAAAHPAGDDGKPDMTALEPSVEFLTRRSMILDDIGTAPT
jgi:hypothetical protein